MANFFKVGPVGGGGGEPFDEQLIDDGLELAGMNIRDYSMLACLWGPVRQEDNMSLHQHQEAETIV
jgi:hypothetical protein